MGRLRLQTQLLIATLLIICILTIALLFVLRRTVSSEIDRQVQESTEASLRAFENVQRQREFELSRTAAMLAELPNLKAMMDTDHPLTIQDASESVWKLAGSDLCLLADSNGKIVGFHVRKPGLAPALVERDFKRSVEQGEEAAWWYANGQLYWVFLYPITSGTGNFTKQLGVIAVGYQVDSAVVEQLALVPGSQIALTTGNTVIASTLPPHEEDEWQSRISREGIPAGSGNLDLALGAEQYRVSSVLVHDAPPATVQFYVLMSLESENRFIQQLNRTIFILGIFALLSLALLLNLVSRRITSPLEDLVAGVRALAAGDYTYSITPRGSSEVTELGQAFSKMRGDLLESQKKWLAAERIGALGRAASFISHDLRHHLAAIVANAEFLYEAEKMKLDRKEIYDEIKGASEQMTDLLDSLRELARDESSISSVRSSLDYTVRRAVALVLARPEFRSRLISIHTSGEMEGMFDPKKIERAIFNLVLNACEATAQRQDQISIEVQSFMDTFEVRIIDNGPGIPVSIRSSLFDPFVSSGKPNGTGLGLAIVNKIVHDHQGSVSIEQTSETGTVFLVRLPRSLRAMHENARPVVI